MGSQVTAVTAVKVALGATLVMAGMVDTQATVVMAVDMATEDMAITVPTMGTMGTMGITTVITDNTMADTMGIIMEATVDK